MRAKKVKTRHPGYIVAIDGPAGAGKSTVSRKLAEALDGRLLDTGAMYRGVAYFSLKQRADNPKLFVEIARELKFDMDLETGSILINSEDMGSKLRSEKVSQMASYVSQFKGVRAVLTRRQRSLARKWSVRLPVIVEGRDIGTVVFPKVQFKFFVTADADIRAWRRYQQLKKQGVKGISLKSISAKALDRDRKDSSRKVAPLKCPKDAIVVDTTNMGIAQVVQFMTNHIRASLDSEIKR